VALFQIQQNSNFDIKAVSFGHSDGQPVAPAISFSLYIVILHLPSLREKSDNSENVTKRGSTIFFLLKTKSFLESQINQERAPKITQTVLVKP
jgi:hypothetical protein